MKQARWTITAVALGSALALSASPAFAKGYKVGVGQEFTSIQDAVDAAEADGGGKVTVYPGVYQEVNANSAAVTITKPMKLIAKIDKSDPLSAVVIIPNPGQNHGILAEGTESTHIDGLQIKNFTVQGFPKNGIWLRYVDNFKIDSNKSIDNLENGIWPTLSANGLVKKNTSYGSDDSALWVEASTNVRVLSNTLYDSVTGLEVTISSDVEMMKNTVYNNTVGVGLYHPNGAGMDIPPGLVPGGWVLKKNTITDNNCANTAPPASLAGALPPGGGMLVFGVDGVQAENNVISDNDFYGIAVVDYCAGVAGGPNDCGISPAIVEGFPELNVFSNNELTGNGTAPAGTCSNSGDMCVVVGDCPAETCDAGLCSVSGDVCVVDGDCAVACDAHPLADYAADFTYILTDIFDPAPSPPYLPNTACGTTPGTFTKDGIGTTGGPGTTMIFQAKC